MGPASAGPVISAFSLSPSLFRDWPIGLRGALRRRSLLRPPRDRALGNSDACVLVVFDLLDLEGGEDLRARPLSERRSVSQ